MSEAYERERQNNSRLDELSAKVSALRGVTIDIYDNARAQDVIDNTVCRPLSLIKECLCVCVFLTIAFPKISPTLSPPCALPSPAPPIVLVAWPLLVTRLPSSNYRGS